MGQSKVNKLRANFEHFDVFNSFNFFVKGIQRISASRQAISHHQECAVYATMSAFNGQIEKHPGESG
jgi:hypothetical protein